MNSVLSHEVVRALVVERQREAAAAGRAARVVSARRWQRRAELAASRDRLARLAIQ